MTQWKGFGEDLEGTLREACRSHVENVLPTSDKMFAAVLAKDDVLRRDRPHELLQNIPLIGIIGAALYGHAPSSTRPWHNSTPALRPLRRNPDLRTGGFTEGVAYDGYVLDFIADWLSTLPEAERAPILDHPNLKHDLDECCLLAAPGAVEQVAEAKRCRAPRNALPLLGPSQVAPLPPDADGGMAVGGCRLDWLRSDALAACTKSRAAAGRCAAVGARDAHYAAVLRNGWDANDLAVAVACSNSPMDHIQSDNGTLVIGTRGNWLITDPGYQQYAKGDERDFTVGPTAHNAPLINGIPQTFKQPRRVALEDVAV